MRKKSWAYLFYQIVLFDFIFFKGEAGQEKMASYVKAGLKLELLDRKKK